MDYDTLIHNGTIVTVNSGFDVIDNGWVGVTSGTIACVAENVPGVSLPAANRVVDAGGGLILPGLVNCHTHLPMSLFRGLADDLPLMEWLNEHMFPAEAAHINPDSARFGALLSCMELLLSGTTCCCDGYFYGDAVAAATGEIGMRVVVGQGVIDFPAPGVPDPAENVMQAETFVERWLGRTDLVVPSIFCHSPYTCSTETLIAAKTAADRRGVLFQIHVAETEAELEQIRSEHNTSPVGYLDRIGLLDANTLAIHCVWVDADDVAVLARRKTAVAHCPESNMKLASGIAPVAALKEAGVCIGIGTDGSASNNDLDMFSEMDTAAKLQKVASKDPTALDAVTVLRMATIDGARAIGLDRLIGSIEVGKAADLIIADTDRPHLVPMYNPVSHVVFSMHGADVRDVMIAGEWRVRNRRIEMLDEAVVMDGVRRLARKIGVHAPGGRP